MARPGQERVGVEGCARETWGKGRRRPSPRTWPRTRVQTLGHRGRVDEVPAAQAAGDVGVYVPEFNLSGQHLWLLQENAQELISEMLWCFSSKVQVQGK